MGWDIGATGFKIVLGAEVARAGASSTSAATSTASWPSTG